MGAEEWRGLEWSRRAFPFVGFSVFLKVALHFFLGAVRGEGRDGVLGEEMLGVRGERAGKEVGRGEVSGEEVLGVRGEEVVGEDGRRSD